MKFTTVPHSVLLLAVLLFSVTACSDGPENDSEADAPSITSSEAEYRDLSISFTISSEVIPYKRVYVASRMTGLIEEVHYEEGDRVNQGDLMARIDVRQEQAELRRANATLVEAEDVYYRTSQLYERDAATRAELLEAERNLEQAKSDVELLELRIEFGEIKAPADAVVTSRLIEVGNNVSANERVFSIADLDLLVVRPGVSEMNLSGLDKGQHVDLKFDVYPDRVFQGTIRRIFPDADPETRLFTVEVEIHQEEDKPTIRPGYLVRSVFTADERSHVLSVPSEAVVERENSHFLFVLNDAEDQVELREIEIGVQRDGYAEIQTGLDEGEKVAAANLDALDDGSAVNVVGTFRRSGFRN